MNAPIAAAATMLGQSERPPVVVSTRPTTGATKSAARPAQVTIIPITIHVSGSPSSQSQPNDAIQLR